MDTNQMKGKHIFYVAAGVITLSLGFTILWQNISISGPTTLAPETCSAPYSIWLNNSKGQDTKPRIPTKIALRATNNKNDNVIKSAVAFYADSACTTKITEATIAKDTSLGQFYVKFSAGSLTGNQSFKINADASRFWSGAFNVIATIGTGTGGGGGGGEGTINFGALINNKDTTTRVSTLKQLGVSYARSSITLANWNGKNTEVDQLLANGFKLILNINNKLVGRDANGNKVPNYFPTDMVSYRAQLSAVLDKYHPEVVVIENEPTTRFYFDVNDTMANYLTELQNAIEVCHQHGVKVADGALASQLVQMVMAGQEHAFDRAMDTKELIEGYAKLDLDYVNIHVGIPYNVNANQDTFPAGDLTAVANYLKQQTGHDVISNEYSFHNDSAALVTSTVNEFIAANKATGQFHYSIAYSGDPAASPGDDARDFVSGTGLSAHGIAFRDAIIGGGNGLVPQKVPLVTPPSNTISVPVITSLLTVSVPKNITASYQIQATNTPTSYDATGLPSGIVINKTTGVLSGKVTLPGTYTITITATNSAGTGSATLVVKVL